MPKTIHDLLRDLSALVKIDSDFVGLKEESAVLPSKMEDTILKKQYAAALIHYEKTLENFGTEEILNGLLMEIASRINKLGYDGESAALNAEQRAATEGELGKYHTALRALLDNEHLRPNTTFSADVGTIPIRQILAIYWLAASDENMQVCEHFQSDLKTLKPEGIRNASIENFIGTLQEIQRAHNNPKIPLQKKDDISCAPGTLSRILLRASIYNADTAIPGLQINQIPEHLRESILASFEQFSSEKKIIALNYLKKILLDDETPTEEEQAHYFQLLNTIPHHFNPLSTKEKVSIASLPDIQPQLDSLLIEMCRVECHTLKLNSPDVRVDTQFVRKIMQCCARGQAAQLLRMDIAEEVLNFRLEQRKFYLDLFLLHRNIQNAYFCFQYAERKAFDSISIINTHLEELQMALIQLDTEWRRITQSFENIIQTIATQAQNKGKEEIGAAVTISEAQRQMAIESHFGKNTKNTEERIKKLFIDIDSLFSGKREFKLDIAKQIVFIAVEKEADNQTLVLDLEALNRLLSLIPPGEMADILCAINTYLANPAFVSLLDREPATQLIRASLLKGKNIDLLDPAYQSKTVFSVFLKKIAENAEKICAEQTHEAVSTCLTKAFFTTAKLPLYATVQSPVLPQENLNQWLETAIQICAHFPNNLSYLKLFVLLTFFNNLGVVEITRENRAELEALCDLLMSASWKDINTRPYFQTPSEVAAFEQTLLEVGVNLAELKLLSNSLMFYSWEEINAMPLSLKPKEITFFEQLLHGKKLKPENYVYPNPKLLRETRLQFLANHMAVLLTTLKPISTLVNASTLAIMSRDESDKKLIDSFTPHSHSVGYILRTSRTQPNMIVVCFILDSPNSFHPLKSENYLIGTNNFELPSLARISLKLRLDNVDNMIHCCIVDPVKFRGELEKHLKDCTTKPDSYSMIGAQLNVALSLDYLKKTNAEYTDSTSRDVKRKADLLDRSLPYRPANPADYSWKENNKPLRGNFGSIFSSQSIGPSLHSPNNNNTTSMEIETGMEAETGMETTFSQSH